MTPITTADITEDHLSLVVGADYRFDNSLYLNLEYLYNGAAEPDNYAAGLARQLLGQNLSLSRHQLGCQITYDVHPLITAQLAGVCSLSDRSGQISPGVSISIADEAELVLGAIIGSGKRPGALQPAYVSSPGNMDIVSLPIIESEYGTWPNVYYVEFKYYF